MLLSPLPPLSPHLLAHHHHQHCPSPLLPINSNPTSTPNSPWFTPRSLSLSVNNRKRPSPLLPINTNLLSDADADPASSLDQPSAPAPASVSEQGYTRPLKRVRFNYTSHAHAQNSFNRDDPVGETIYTPTQRQGVTPLTGAIPTLPATPPNPVHNRSNMDIDTNIANASVDMMNDESEPPKRPRMARIDNANSSSTTSSSDDMPSIPSTSRTSSPTLPPRLHLKRPNLKKLSLALPSSYSNSSSDSSTPTPTCPMPSSPSHAGSSSSSLANTPYTPGPPKTPALAMSLGRASLRGLSRPSLLSLITQPSGDDDVPPTPGGASYPYGSVRPVQGKVRARSYTAAGALSHVELDKGGARSAYPLTTSTFSAIDEAGSSSSSFGFSMPTTLSPQSGSASPTTSTSTSASESTATTPSTSPPLPTAFTFTMPMSFPSRPVEPYEDGPIEVLPGIFLGAENSVDRFDVWARDSTRVRVVNVAQEIDDPFDPSTDPTTFGWSKSKGKGKMKLATYAARANTPEIDYCHVRWSHGELGLAEVPEDAKMEDLLEVTAPDSKEMWRFWEAIRWMEEGRRAGVPVLIHCQCGVSRSATLTIAYVMTLAAMGAMPDLLGHIRSMQEAYDFVKAKSSWIGPNHSLVFQLVDFARLLTSLLCTYVSTPGARRISTSFPSSSEAELSEAEWARRRREFEESENGSLTSSPSGSGSELELGGMSPEEVTDEARRWDEAMLLRKAARF